MGRHKIFFATRPIAPPWDGASKNLVYYLARELDDFSVSLLTYKGQREFLDRPHVNLMRVYQRTDSRLITMGQKVAFLSSLMLSSASIFHFFFTPELFSSKVIKLAKMFKSGKFLQTFAAPIFNEEIIPRLVFGDLVTVQSDFSLKMMKRNGVRDVRRIYSGVDTDFYKPGVECGELKRQLGISDDQQVVLYCGNYSLGCNDDLVRAVLILTKKLPRVKFIFACRINLPDEKGKRDAMKAELEREGVLGHVSFLDSVVDVRPLIALSDIHIFPLRSMLYKSDIPLVLLESLAMEKPIIISDIAPLNEIMKDDVGEVVEPGNAEMLADSIERLLADKSSRVEKGKRGRRLVQGEFSYRGYIDNYKNLYDELLNM